MRNGFVAGNADTAHQGWALAGCHWFVLGLVHGGAHYCSKIHHKRGSRMAPSFVTLLVLKAKIGSAIKLGQIAVITGDKAFEFHQRDRAGVAEALHLVAILGDQEGFVFAGFHTLGDDLQVQ